MIAFDTIGYLSLGVVAGLLSGLLGVGGGLLVVPGLAFLFSYHHLVAQDLVMRLAASSSLTAMIITTAFALRAHYAHGVTFWPIFRLLLPSTIIGTIGGSLLSSFLPGSILKVLFGFFVLIIAIRTFFPEKIRPSRQLPGPFVNSLMGFSMGLISATLGIGGSTLVIPYLIYYNVPMRNAIAVSAACGLAIAFIATLMFSVIGWQVDHLPKWSTGYIYWPAVLGVGLTSPWFATLGAALSHRLSVFMLRRVFAIMLLCIAIDMLIS